MRHFSLDAFPILRSDDETFTFQWKIDHFVLATYALLVVSTLSSDVHPRTWCAHINTHKSTEMANVFHHFDKTNISTKGKDENVPGLVHKWESLVYGNSVRCLFVYKHNSSVMYRLWMGMDEWMDGCVLCTRALLFDVRVCPTPWWHGCSWKLWSEKFLSAKRRCRFV